MHIERFIQWNNHVVNYGLHIEQDVLLLAILKLLPSQIAVFLPRTLSTRVFYCAYKVLIKNSMILFTHQLIIGSDDDGCGVTVANKALEI